jgi:HPt (histidine-containing phosphotransfer) domain-containing protein
VRAGEFSFAVLLDEDSSMRMYGGVGSTRGLGAELACWVETLAQEGPIASFGLGRWDARVWLDEMREDCPRVRFPQRHLVTLWFLDGRFAARDARAGDAGRRRDAERMREAFRRLREETRATGRDLARSVIEPQRVHDAICGADWRQSVRRSPVRLGAGTIPVGALGGRAVNDPLELATVLRGSREIRTPLDELDGVRAVVTGIAPNAPDREVARATRRAEMAEVDVDVDAVLDQVTQGPPITSEAGRAERALVAQRGATVLPRGIVVEREHKQLMAIERLGEDRDVAIELVNEVGKLVDRLTTEWTTPELEKRLLHTVKGNAALFGLSAFAARCHEIEDAMALDGRRMSDHEASSLRWAWKTIHHRLWRFIDVAEGSVRRDVEASGLESLAVRFQRIAEQARELARWLGKDPVRVQIEDGGFHVDRDSWAPFWSAFGHAVCNAIDHGIEDSAERARLGKGAGRLTLRSYLGERAVVLELSDDGRGIAWDAVRVRVRAAGLPAETHGDLVAALFRDGISTRSQVTELSGRGVGLGVLAEACRTMGCTVTVESRPGQGTTMRFELPAGLTTSSSGSPSRSPDAAP